MGKCFLYLGGFRIDGKDGFLQIAKKRIHDQGTWNHHDSNNTEIRRWVGIRQREKDQAHN